MLRLRPVFSTLFLFLVLAGQAAFGQTVSPDPEAEAADQKIMAAPQPDATKDRLLKGGTTAGGNTASEIQTGQPASGSPQGGITLFQRMDVPLPPLPPEKPYTGKIDEAYGAYQRGDYLAAMDLSIPKAKAGDAAAQTLIAEMLRNGEGMAQDLTQAAFWYGKAAEQGDPNAMLHYALLLLSGSGGLTRDKAKSDAYMEKAAKAGQPVAAFNWAQVLVAEKPGPEGLKAALPFYEVSAEKGIPDAQYALSQIYITLAGVEPDKRKTARDWLMRAARAGYDTAQFDLASWLINGTEGERDLESGFKWMKIAASRGHVLAQNKLAHLYINAIGTKPDPVEAIKWYVLSRRAGLKDLDLQDYFLGVEDATQTAGIEAANRFRQTLTQ